MTGEGGVPQPRAGDHDQASAVAAGLSEPPTDHQLLDRVREGDTTPLAQLYQRHRGAALTVARRHVRDAAAADDLVSEAFIRTFEALRRGSGPREAFRPYLLTVLRRTAFDWTGDERKARIAHATEAYPGSGIEGESDPAAVLAERALIARAFRSLPERWQVVLWHTEVDGESPSRIGPLLGLSAAAVSSLALRAREGLKRAYLQEHLSDGVTPGCGPFAGLLGAYVRGGLGTRENTRVGTHLSTCANCRHLLHGLHALNGKLGGVLGPVVLGGGITAAVTGLAPGAAHVVGAAAAGETGARGGVLGSWLLRTTRAVKSNKPAATAAGVVMAILLAALAFALTGNHSPAPHPAPRAAAPASPRVLPRPAPPAPAPPAPVPPAPVPPAHPAPAAPAPVKPAPPAPAAPPPAPRPAAPAVVTSATTLAAVVPVPPAAVPPSTPPPVTPAPTHPPAPTPPVVAPPPPVPPKPTTTQPVTKPPPSVPPVVPTPPPIVIPTPTSSVLQPITRCIDRFGVSWRATSVGELFTSLDTVAAGCASDIREEVRLLLDYVLGPRAPCPARVNRTACKARQHP